MGQPLLVLLAAVIVTGSACLWAVTVTPETAQTLVAWLLGVAAVLSCGAVTFAAYGARRTRQLQHSLAAKDADLTRLAEDMMPALVRRLRDGASADTALAEIPRPADVAHQRILWTLAQEISRVDRMRAAAMSACANAAGRVQALATTMLADLREMEDRHNEEVLGDLLKLDHSTAQAGRLADSIAVLTGARSGRRWTKPIVMESILRGAVGRISAYQRVRVHSASTVAVAGYAAEGVMHALAELMDNATSFSPPSEEVHVYVEEVSTGVVITVEDCGLVMGAAALNRAEKAVSSEPLDLTTLSGTRLGLAVVGCLARKHGMTVSFRPSSRGGTGVVVMIPQQLITQFSRNPRMDMQQPAGAPVQRPARHASATAETAVPPDSAAPPVPMGDGEAHGLPKRRRGQTLAATASAPSSSPTPPPAPAPRPERPRSDQGARFSAFRQATRGGGTGAGTPPPAAPPPPRDDIR
jgi:signal transduction histidine kinase